MAGTTNSSSQVPVEDRLECSGFSHVYTSRNDIGRAFVLTQTMGYIAPRDTDHKTRPLIGFVATRLTQDHHCTATVHRSVRLFGKASSRETTKPFSLALALIGYQIDGPEDDGRRA